MEKQRPWTFFREAFDAAPVGMLIVNGQGNIVDANSHLVHVFGYARDELLGKPVELLVASDSERHRAQRNAFLGSPQTRPMGAGRDLFGKRKDGVRIPVEIGLTPLRTEEDSFVIATIVDITERKHSQQMLEASVAEKEILLKELHHRAKNNLALIGSLLDLAADDGSPNRLRECRSRIDSIALVHEKLYQSGTFARVQLGEYLTTLGEQVALAWARPGQAQREVKVEAENLWLPLDQAVPCGLIVNELITNAFKHAWAPSRSGTVTVRAVMDGKLLSLSVSDDGVGQDPASRPTQGHIGLELVTALSRQLRAKLATQSNAGTMVTLTFPLSET